MKGASAPGGEHNIPSSFRQGNCAFAADAYSRIQRKSTSIERKRYPEDDPVIIAVFAMGVKTKVKTRPGRVLILPSDHRVDHSTSFNLFSFNVTLVGIHTIHSSHLLPMAIMHPPLQMNDRNAAP
jgi:hypothetical protein